MTRKQIEEYRVKLVQIQIDNNTNKKWKETRDLALEIGASIWRIHPFKYSDVKALTHNETKMKIMEAKEATMAEIVYNIHYVLQTAAMINMCRTANRNWIIAIIASSITLLSMVAVWVAVIK